MVGAVCALPCWLAQQFSEAMDTDLSSQAPAKSPRGLPKVSQRIGAYREFVPRHAYVCVLRAQFVTYVHGVATCIAHMECRTRIWHLGQPITEPIMRHALVTRCTHHPAQMFRFSAVACIAFSLCAIGLSLTRAEHTVSHAPTVAIIGAGVGGAFTAYTLSKEAADARPLVHV